MPSPRPARHAARRPAVLAAGSTLALLAAGALAGCGDSGERLTIYSGRTENLVGPLLAEFAEENGVDIDVRYGQSADLALLIETEGEDSPADVFISQSPGAVGFLDEAGLLGTLDADVVEAVPEDFRSADGSWVGMSGRVRTLVHNTDLVAEADLPESVFDLTDERYAGQVALAPANGSFQDFVTALRETEGDDTAAEWLEGMAANDSPEYANNTSIVQAVGRGEVPMGLVNHYYNVRALAEDPDVPSANHFFTDGDLGNLVITTAVAEVASNDAGAVSDEFVEFLLSERAQTFFAEETFEYPLAAGVEPVDELPGLASLGVATFDSQGLGGGLERTRELIDDSGLGG